jgi:hypothetical protein
LGRPTYSTFYVLSNAFLKEVGFASKADGFHEREVVFSIVELWIAEVDRSWSAQKHMYLLMSLVFMPMSKVGSAVQANSHSISTASCTMLCTM